MSVEAAVERDLEQIPRTPMTEGLRATALAMARVLDGEDRYATSAQAKATCARELRETLDRLRELAPPPETKDGIDAINDGRDARRAAAANPVGT